MSESRILELEAKLAAAESREAAMREALRRVQEELNDPNRSSDGRTGVLVSIDTRLAVAEALSSPGSGHVSPERAAEMVAEEREACARLAERCVEKEESVSDYFDAFTSGGNAKAKSIAAAIRSRSSEAEKAKEGR